MPIKPKPTTYKCPSCHWKKTVAPQGDALMPWDYFDECPVCGEKELKRVQLSSFDITIQEIKNIFV